ncbi:MAG: ABC transporter permease [Candidatus Heimdallarchaeota archaeon]
MSKRKERSKSSLKRSGIGRKIKYFFIGIGKSTRRIANQVGGISLGYVRSPSALFWTVVFPITLILLFGAIFGRSIDTTYELYVYDQDNSEESSEFSSYLDKTTSLKVEVINDTELVPLDWVIENNKIILLVIPINWGFQINHTDNVVLTVYYDPSSSAAQSILQIIEEAVAAKNLQLLEVEEDFGLEIENFYVRDLTFLDAFVPGVIMISVTTISMIIGLSYDIEEKRSGIKRKFATTPVFRFEWIFAKQIWQIFIALLVSTLTVLFALIYDFNATSLHPLMLVFVIFGSLTFSGVAMVLVRIIRNPEGVMAASMLFLIPNVLLSGALIPFDTLPLILQYVARATPLYYLTEGMRLLMLDYTREQFWLIFFIAGTIAVGLFTLGILVTKWRDE